MQSENTQPENIQSNSLPDNAYRELRPGEEYHPVMPAASRPKEVTLYSVLFGIVMAIRLFRRRRLPGPSGRAGLRSGYPHRHHRGGRG